MDYSILYKESYDSADDLGASNNWDVFISAYNESDRVKGTYKSANAVRKIWILHEEYGFAADRLPKGEDLFQFPMSVSESQNVRQFFADTFDDLDKIKDLKICIDSTGFMRPALMFLILYIRERLKVKKFDVLYSEPKTYAKNENTTFSTINTGKVRTVDGFDAASDRDVTGDLLIIGPGFDDVLIAAVAEEKKHAAKIQIIGFPSLQADMYQQNLYRASKVDEVSSNEEDSIWFSPAHDPFETANALGRIVQAREKRKRVTNLFLSPLSTKAQAIGFALFYINECFGKRSASILIPETKGYSEKTSYGISHIWKYCLEFPD